MTYIVYHTQNGVANIILYLHQNIEEEHFMEYPYKDGDEKQIANRLRGMAYQGIIRLNPFMDKFVYAVNTSEIIHFYKMGSDFNFSPFLGNDIYLELRNSKKVTDQISDKILNCKSIFYGPVKIVGGNDFCFMESRIYQILKRFYLYYKQL